MRASSIAGAVAISCVQEHEILHHLLEFGTPGPGGTRTNPIYDPRSDTTPFLTIDWPQVSAS